MARYSNKGGLLRIFLVQSSGKRPAKHFTETFTDRTYADEVAEHHYYRNEAWDIKPRDNDFGKVRPGDYVVHYWTGNVVWNRNAIKHLYEVTELRKIEPRKISSALKSGALSDSLTGKLRNADLNVVTQNLRRHPHILLLRPHMTLRRRLGLAEVKKMVLDGKLSKKMGRCGNLGFNICQTSWEDYNAILEWNKSQEVIDTPVLAEKELRDYLAARCDLKVLGPDYAVYELVQKEYDTRGVGRIDLLYRDIGNGDFLVVELKKTQNTDRAVVGQIASYMGWVRDNLAEGKGVSGLIISGSPSPELLAAVRGMRNCKLASFQVDLKFNVIES
ncbi:MAG: hypothetical protein FJ316_04910 [SAR202 cluster bacterium]|nr:hypothetical protein [SAR202 cluster bacterium]